MEIKYIEEFNGKYCIIKQIYDKYILVVIKDKNIVFDIKNNKFSLILSNHKLLPLKPSNWASVIYAYKNNSVKKLERNFSIYK